MGRHVVVLEDQAHRAVGHFAESAAELARAFCELGCTVDLLTAEGWVGEQRGQATPFRVTRASPPVRAVLQFSRRYASLRPAGVRARMLRLLGRVTRFCAIAAMVRRALREDPSAEIVMYAYGVRPDVAAALDGPGRIVHHTFWKAPAPHPTSLPGRAVDAIARRAEAARRRHGGGFRIAVGNDQLLESWCIRAPYLRPVRLRHALVPPSANVPGARAQLGVPESANVAIVFGTLHGSKDLDTVWRAFEELPEWTLLVVGTVAHSYTRWREDHDAPDAVVHGGFVDDAIKWAAFSAADVVVLSFVEGLGLDSGVLLDALAVGVPVVCTDGTRPAADVERFGLGTCFAAGDAHSLADAVRRAPRALDQTAVDAALAETSAIEIARAHLAAFDELPTR